MVWVMLITRVKATRIMPRRRDDSEGVLGRDKMDRK